LDENVVDPAILTGWGVAGTAVAGVILILKFLLTPLFTRLSKKDALEHPKRKHIFEFIQLHPGANFREVARSTGIASGTVRHHLTVLGRAGHIVEHHHASTVRLFENHGKFDNNWADLVLLREESLAKLHGWLMQHPQSPQKAILSAMELEGWSRSTTQHRLARLMEGGLLTIRLQGRLKIYNAVAQSKPKTPSPGLVPMALRSATT
jgi:predicted transcriptional regulator